MGCSSCAKCLLIFINVIVVILGLGILAVGAVAHLRQDILLELISQIPVEIVQDILQGFDVEGFLDATSIAFMVAGSVIFFVGFCGCCGAITNNTCLLVVYAIVVGVIILAQVVGGILIAFYTAKVEEQVKVVLKDSLESYKNPNGGVSVSSDGQLMIGVDKVRLAWDGTQILMGCCGVENGSDYKNVFSGKYDIANSSSAAVPISCCTFINVNDYKASRSTNQTTVVEGITEVVQSVQMCLEDAHPNHTHTQGCYTKVIDLIKDYWYIAIGILVGTLLIELVGFISACIIMKSNREEK